MNRCSETAGATRIRRRIDWYVHSQNGANASDDGKDDTDTFTSRDLFRAEP